MIPMYIDAISLSDTLGESSNNKTIDGKVDSSIDISIGSVTDNVKSIDKSTPKYLLMVSSRIARRKDIGYHRVQRYRSGLYCNR